MNWIVGIVGATWEVGLESAPYVLLGFAVAGLIRGLLRPGVLTKHLGKNNLSTVVKAALFGIPIPLCSCGVVAAAGAIRKEGASKGATSAFLIATPETGVDSLSIAYALLDPLFTVVRPIAAFITATTAGFAEVLLDPEKAAPPAAEGAGSEAPCCCSSRQDDDGKTETALALPPLRQRIGAGIRFSFTDLLYEIGPLLILGLVLAGGISWLIPDGFFERFLGSGFLSMVVMLAAGIPLYVCATASTPIAAALIAKGLSPGAALVFLSAGPATNAATIGVVAKLLGKRSAVIYVGSIAVCSLLLGLALNAIYGGAGIEVRAMQPHEHAVFPDWFRAVAMMLLMGLIARAWWVMRRPVSVTAEETPEPPLVRIGDSPDS